MLFSAYHLLLSLFVLQVAAFYPFYPAYRCIDEGKCIGPSKRSVEHVAKDVITDVKKGFALKIKQVMPKNDMTPELRIARYADRLTKKFKDRASAQNGKASMTKRANTYSIMLSNPPTQSNSAAIDQDGTDYSYVAVVNFGSNNTPLYMLLDTGAANSWVMDTSCTSPACLKHNTYGPTNSKTYNASTSPFSILYGTGAVSGTYATDTITFAGITTSLTFGSATTTSSDFLNFPLDGILGLSQSANSNPPTFLASLVSSKALKSNIFGVNLNRASDGAVDGEINFGAPDTSKYTGDLSYNSLTANGGNWKIAVDDAGFNGVGAGFKGQVAIIDTGTSFCFIPSAQAKTLYALMPGAVLSSDGSSYSVPCSTTTPMQFTFSGKTYNISAKDWVGGKIGTTTCTSNVYPRDASGDGSWLLGDTFLKNVYAVFDVDQNRVGLGMKSASVSGSSTSVSSTLATATSTTTPSSSTSTSVAPSSTNGVIASSTSSKSATSLPSNTVSTVVSSSSAASNTTITGTPMGFNAAVSSSIVTTPTPTAPASTSPIQPAASASPTGGSGRVDTSLLSVIPAMLAALIMVI